MASFKESKAKLLGDPDKKDMLKRFEAITRTGEMVRYWRKARGLTQQELADKIRSTQESISRIELGNMREGPTLPMLASIANACGRQLALTDIQLENTSRSDQQSWEVIPSTITTSESESFEIKVVNSVVVGMVPEIKGRVKWFNAEKGFGFVQGEGGEKVFVQTEKLRQLPPLIEGDSVRLGKRRSSTSSDQSKKHSKDQ